MSKRSAAWGDRWHNVDELRWALDRRLRWASNQRLDEQSIGGVRRSVVEEKFAWERDMREWLGRYSAKKKGLGRWESDQERDWERWEMGKTFYYFINRSNKKLFFFFALRYNITMLPSLLFSSAVRPLPPLWYQSHSFLTGGSVVVFFVSCPCLPERLIFCCCVPFLLSLAPP